MKLKHFFIFIVLYTNIVLTKSNCISGINCPYNRGKCIKQKCVCIYGYTTLLNETNPDKTIYCTYKQTDRIIPFILEFFLPTVGLFVLGRKLHGIIKLICFIGVIHIAWGDIYTYNIILTFLFVLIYLFDLIFLATGIYNDGNGIALL